MLFSADRIRSIVFACAALVAGALCAAPASADATATLTIAGIQRSYRLHVPDRPPPKAGFPVLLVFHGRGGTGERMQRLSGFDEIADRRGFIVLYPDGIDRGWNDGRTTIPHPQDDVGFVSALLDRIETTEPVDAARIYAAGLSNGALFAHRLACQLSERIFAIAAVAGTLPADIEAGCRPPQPVAVLQIDGTADRIMPYDGGAVRQLGGRGVGGTVLPVDDSAAFWARHNGCGEPAADEPLPPVAPGDITHVVRTSYTGCPPGGGVTVLKVEGGGHAWPGDRRRATRFLRRTSRQIDASEAIADFVLALPPR
ncbi:alpha/beta hydrolase family esterase [Mangrovibrevibacter kandeliae]|uniref:alpha/beta hydrolase family esterase n=1 Tax=Mangrovibrevibacter kandeliae TaxID=2968473 RepID=UPI0021177679|nr:PHB depolymerase family esterase [Aurantimonas sp. CSK15Z-1]MCQ8781020.1 hypothetical protein [Aurantimonas sp. CSK15Z-1]